MTSYRHAPKAWRFHDLAPFRVHEVLLVSSPYDAFILEQDGQLTEQVFLAYRDISPQASPRFTHAPSGEAALELLRSRHFDLIISMVSQADVDASAFGRQVKKLRPGRPVVLLALDRRELHQLRSHLDPEAIDGAFLWTGDATILLAIIKFVEDRQNVDHDVREGDVRVIITVEDSAAHYSSFLGLLYKELIRQACALHAEGANDLLRRLQMRSCPKVLLATSFEEGVALLERYRKNLMAIICDVRIPHGGSLDDRGGLDFVKRARAVDPDLPVLLQSAEEQNRELATALGATFVAKGSPSLLAEIRDFLIHAVGFGDFVFREERDGPPIAQAQDLRKLAERLASVSERSIVYHARRNHFSIWLLARSEFELAERLRPRKVSDFGNPEGLRRYLIEGIRETRRETHLGVISDFNRQHFEQDPFTRIGHGSLGGKARGLAFLNMLLANRSNGGFAGLGVEVPRTVVIAADQFDLFLEENDLHTTAGTQADDDELVRRFLAAALPETVESELAFLAEAMDRPLAVRSSSLLEDSLHQPFAGIYSTLMIPNSAASIEERARQLGNAIKLVYASTFFRDARSYLSNTGHRAEEEKMAVIVQPVAGRRHGDRFYPSFSGVAQSFNYYPIPPQRADDGVVHVALGLGRLVVDGGQALRFSPRHPQALPQFGNVKTFLDHSQRAFYALDMKQDCCGPGTELSRSVHSFGLEVAETDGSLWPVGSVFSASEQRIRDDLSSPGPRIVTFNNILKHRAIPLAEAIARLLEIASAGLGGAVEIEFACELGDWGRPRRRGVKHASPRLYILQVRPIVTRGDSLPGAHFRFSREETLCASKRCLGNGVEVAIQDLVYVRRDRWDPARHPEIAAEVGEINELLSSEDVRYVLLGPGRWGTSDPWLGIPVTWSQISNVGTVVEASPAGYEVEPSQGTHFFQNITSLGIGYLTLPPGARKEDPACEEFVDWAWLDRQPAARETPHLRHVRLEAPLTVVLDGRVGVGSIALPGARGPDASSGAEQADGGTGI